MGEFPWPAGIVVRCADFVGRSCYLLRLHTTAQDCDVERSKRAVQSQKAVSAYL